MGEKDEDDEASRQRAANFIYNSRSSRVNCCCACPEPQDEVSLCARRRRETVSNGADAYLGRRDEVVNSEAEMLILWVYIGSLAIFECTV